MTILAATVSSGITSGSIVIACTIGLFGVAVLGVMVKLMPQGSAAIDLAQKNAEQWRDLHEGAELKLKEQEAELKVQRDATASALESVDLSKDEIASLRETIAELRARPDTQQMLGTFEAHHQENQSAMQLMVSNQTAMLGELKKVGDGLTVLLTRAEQFRTSDRPNKTSP